MSYYELAKKFHPDVNPEEQEKFKSINEAYEILGDDLKRNRYDQLIMGSTTQRGGI